MQNEYWIAGAGIACDLLYIQANFYQRKKQKNSFP